MGICGQALSLPAAGGGVAPGRCWRRGQAPLSTCCGARSTPPGASTIAMVETADSASRSNSSICTPSLAQRASACALERAELVGCVRALGARVGRERCAQSARAIFAYEAQRAARSQGAPHARASIATCALIM